MNRTIYLPHFDANESVSWACAMSKSGRWCCEIGNVKYAMRCEADADSRKELARCRIYTQEGDTAATEKTKIQRRDEFLDTIGTCRRLALSEERRRGGISEKQVGSQAAANRSDSRATTMQSSERTTRQGTQRLLSVNGWLCEDGGVGGR